MILVNRLPEILESRGIKQTWLCQKAGISKQTLSNCLGDKHNVSLVVALKISKALDVTVECIWSLPKQ